MLSISSVGFADLDDGFALFIQAHDCPVDTAIKQLPAWVWVCEEFKELNVFIQWDDRVLHCSIAQLLLLASE